MESHILDEKLFFPIRVTKFIWTSSRAAFTSLPKQSNKTNTWVLEKAQTSCSYQGAMEAVVFHLLIPFWLRSWLAQINAPPYILPWQLNSDKVLHLTTDQIKMFRTSVTRVPSLTQQSSTFFFLPFPKLMRMVRSPLTSSRSDLKWWVAVKEMIYLGGDELWIQN